MITFNTTINLNLTYSTDLCWSDILSSNVIVIVLLNGMIELFENIFRVLETQTNITTEKNLVSSCSRRSSGRLLYSVSIDFPYKSQLYLQLTFQLL